MTLPHKNPERPVIKWGFNHPHHPREMFKIIISLALVAPRVSWSMTRGSVIGTLQTVLCNKSQLLSMGEGHLIGGWRSRVLSPLNRLPTSPAPPNKAAPAVAGRGHHSPLFHTPWAFFSFLIKSRTMMSSTKIRAATRMGRRRLFSFVSMPSGCTFCSVKKAGVWLCC